MKIAVNNTTKKFGPSTVLSNINLELHSGTSYGFQGINGCGKTIIYLASISLTAAKQGTPAH